MPRSVSFVMFAVRDNYDQEIERLQEKHSMEVCVCVCVSIVYVCGWVGVGVFMWVWVCPCGCGWVCPCGCGCYKWSALAVAAEGCRDETGR